MAKRIPVIDIQDFAINVNRGDIDEEKLVDLASQIHHAFSSIGFVYLKNHGITEKQV